MKEKFNKRLQNLQELVDKDLYEYASLGFQSEILLQLYRMNSKLNKLVTVQESSSLEDLLEGFDGVGSDE